MFSLILFEHSDIIMSEASELRLRQFFKTPIFSGLAEMGGVGLADKS